MRNYEFKTIVTMKEYNAKKWWIDRGYIPQTTIEAENVKEALAKYREFAEDHCVSISDNALKTKSPMYIDTKEGVKQVGYVITGKTDFQDDRNYSWSTQYVDLWVNIVEICDDIEFDD